MVAAVVHTVREHTLAWDYYANFDFCGAGTNLFNPVGVW